MPAYTETQLPAGEQSFLTIPDEGAHKDVVVVLIGGTNSNLYDMSDLAQATPGHTTAYDNRSPVAGRMDHGRHWLPAVGLLGQVWKDGLVSPRRSWRDALLAAGFSTLHYLQRAPAQPIAAGDLGQLVGILRALTSAQPQAQIVLMGHSRGGLLARAALIEARSAGLPLERFAMCITLHAPNQGSEVADAAVELDSVLAGRCGWPTLVEALAMSPYAATRLAATQAVASLGVLPGMDQVLTAVRELYGSFADPAARVDYTTVGVNLFWKSLEAREPVANVRYVSFGGTWPHIGARYHTRSYDLMSAVPQPGFSWDALKDGPFVWRSVPVWALVSEEAALPWVYRMCGRDLPPEVRPGQGDCAVSDQRAKLPPQCRPEHHTRVLNHAEALFDSGLQQEVIGVLRGLPTLRPEVANAPLILQDVCVVKAPVAAKPADFGVVPGAGVTRYAASWQPHQPGRRELRIDTSESMRCEPDRGVAYLFARFGHPENHRGLGQQMRTCEVELAWTDPTTNQPAKASVSMTQDTTSPNGAYFWGTFKPPVHANSSPLKMALRVRAVDNVSHWSARVPNGSELDSDPASASAVDSTPPSYPFLSYSPGPDTAHSFAVTAAVNPSQASMHDTAAAPLDLQLVAAPNHDQYLGTKPGVLRPGDTDHYTTALPYQGAIGGSGPEPQQWSDGLVEFRYSPAVLHVTCAVDAEDAATPLRLRVATAGVVLVDQPVLAAVLKHPSFQPPEGGPVGGGRTVPLTIQVIATSGRTVPYALTVDFRPPSTIHRTSALTERPDLMEILERRLLGRPAEAYLEQRWLSVTDRMEVEMHATPEWRQAVDVTTSKYVRVAEGVLADAVWREQSAAPADTWVITTGSSVVAAADAVVRAMLPAGGRLEEAAEGQVGTPAAQATAVVLTSMVAAAGAAGAADAGAVFDRASRIAGGTPAPVAGEGGDGGRRRVVRRRDAIRRAGR